LEQFGLDRLSPDDRLELAGLLWDSLDARPFAPPDWHLRVVAARVARADAEPGTAIPLDRLRYELLGDAP